MEHWQIDQPTTIDLELVRRVRVSLMGGQLNLIAHDDPRDRTARVEVSEVSGHDLRVGLDGDTLTIDQPQLGWANFGASARAVIEQPRATVSVLVPVEVDATVTATSADVLVIGLDGEVAIITMGGEHFADRCVGRLRLTSGGGELSVRDHRGRVEARTATGDITISGELTRFDGNTISGRTILDVSDGTPERITHSSVTGATTVRLPETTNARIFLNTVAGTLRVDDWQAGGTLGRGYSREPLLADQPSTELRCASVSGAITVLGVTVGSAPAPGTRIPVGHLDEEAAVRVDLDSAPRLRTPGTRSTASEPTAPGSAEPRPRDPATPPESQDPAPAVQGSQKPGPQTPGLHTSGPQTSGPEASGPDSSDLDGFHGSASPENPATDATTDSPDHSGGAGTTGAGS